MKKLHRVRRSRQMDWPSPF